MSEPTEGTGPRGPEGPGEPRAGGPEPVGSVGEEAVKLLGALSDWARDQGADYSGSVAGAGDHLSEAVRDLNAHFGTGGEDCRYCPLCQAIQLVRQTSPEVKAHLAVAASSLLHAANGMLAPRQPHEHGTGGPGSGVEKIDLESGDWDLSGDTSRDTSRGDR